MAPSAKGKEKVIDGGKGSGKRNRSDYGDDDKTGGGAKRRNRHILQFFEDAAYEVGQDDQDDSDDDSFFDADFFEDELDPGVEFQNEPSKAPFPSVVPKEEEPSGEELEKILQERYRTGSTFVTFEEDNYETKKKMDADEFWPSVKEPTIWKVKCMVGRERHSAFCLMQKYVDLKYLGHKLQIISAFSVDHIKGFIYIEADNQRDIYEACNGLPNIYFSRVAPVKKDDIAHQFTIWNMGNDIKEGMWARVKSGKYKGDLAQVAAVNEGRTKVTVKLVPRIDFTALAEKIGRGAAVNRTANPAPRLISSSELEEFRPLIQLRRDRDTNKVFEVLDGMMLKDGYLYKKVSVDSLSFWGVTPTEGERLKFEPSKNDECKDLEWLSLLYGEQKKKRPLVSGKGSGKGDGSSSSSANCNFEVNDLVFFGRKDFGVIIGSEKNGIFKIIKSGSEGPVVVNLPQRDIRSASFDKKLFTALDHKSKHISINDAVRVVEGPLKDREGTVKRIYQGIIFLYNETVEENCGYFCIKPKMCEKVERPVEVCTGKGDEPGHSGFGDFTSSPKSPFSPEQSDQGRDAIQKFKREDDAMYSVGQLLRIRVGPLKGYLCRVLAIRRADVTVKLDSKHKVLTVKCEHLSEVRAKSSGISFGDDSGIVKPFDLLGTQDGSTDWMDGASKAAEGGSWNAEGLSTERSSWPTLPTSNSSFQPESESSDPLKAANDESTKGASWGIKTASSQGTSWGTASVARDNSIKSGDGGWGNQEDSAKKSASWEIKASSSQGTSWGTAATAQDTSLKRGEGGWGNQEDTSKESASWEVKATSSRGASWGTAATAHDTPVKSGEGGWGNQEDSSKKSVVGTGFESGASDGWGKAVESLNRTTSKKLKEDSWGQAAGNASVQDDSSGSKSAWNASGVASAKPTVGWGNTGGGSSDAPETTSWNKRKTSDDCQTDSWASKKKDGEEGTDAWGKGAEGSVWNQNAGGSGSSWNKKDVEPSSSKQGGGSSWSKPDGGSFSWSKQGGGSSWNKSEDGSASWCKKDVQMENTGDIDQSGSWGRPETFSGGRSFGGRRGRGRGGRGRSFGQDGTSGWTKRDQDDDTSRAGTFEGNNNDWKKNLSFNQKDKGQDSWAKTWGSNEGTSGWGADGGGATNAGGGSSSGWGESKLGGATDAGGRASSGWGQSKSGGATDASGVTSSGWGQSKSGGGTDAGGGPSSVWGQSKSGGTTDAGGGSSSGWGQSKSGGGTDADGGSSSGWGQSKSGGGTDAGGGPSSVWGQSKSGGTTDAGGGSSLGWGQNKSGGDAAGGSSSGWGQSKSGGDAGGGSSSGWGQTKLGGDAGGGSSSGWGQNKSGGGTDAGGGSSSGWGQSKWGGGTDAGGGSSSGWGQSKWSREQNDTSNDGGRGGNWRGGRGGRWGQDRGGFRGRGRGFGGRGGSDRGDFGDKNDDSNDGGRGGNWRGGRGGRWGQNGGSGSDRGGFGGRGRADRGDFGGGSDGGDFGDKNEDSNDGGRVGNWRGGRGGRWGQNGGSGSDRGGFSGRGRSDRGDFGGGSDGGGFHGRGGFGGRGRGRRDDWNKNDSNSQNAPYSWNNASNKDSSWTSNSGGGSWGSGVGEKGKWQSGNSGWAVSEGTAPGGGDTQGGQAGDIEKTGGWNGGKGKDTGGSDGDTGGWNSKEGNWKTPNSSGTATSSGWNQLDTNKGAGSSGDVWEKGASSSWPQKKDDKDKGEWSWN